MYTPNNVNVYTAAFTGAMSALSAYAILGTASNGSDYSVLARFAGAYAQELDTVYASGSTDGLTVETIEIVSELAWLQRFTSSNPWIGGSATATATYTQLATQVLRIVTASLAWYADEGITPPPISGGGVDPAVIFDDATSADKVNIRSARATNQSPIDNTKVGITNLGSETAAGSGVTANYGTIVGGRDNTVSGVGALAGGVGSQALGDGSVALGTGAGAGGVNACAFGTGTAIGDNSFCGGGTSQSNGLKSAAFNGGVADGDSSFAIGPSGRAELTAEFAQACANGGIRRIFMIGQTTDVTPSTLADLDGDPFLLPPNSSITLKITCMASRIDDTGVSQTFNRTIFLQTNGTVATYLADGSPFDSTGTRTFVPNVTGASLELTTEIVGNLGELDTWFAMYEMIAMPAHA